MNGIDFYNIGFMQYCTFIFQLKSLILLVLQKCFFSNISVPQQEQSALTSFFACLFKFPQ